MGAPESPPGPGLKAGQLRACDVWALGVGIVVCGQYFGWSLGLHGNGPVAFLIASLAVCLLFLAWVLTLSELAVAMPAADGPAAYGRRAGGRALGFLMGWSLFLECLFGGVATALAAGGYVAFLFDPAEPDPTLATAAALATVLGSFLLQVWGVKEQSRALMAMTYGALAALVLFWVLAMTNFSWDRLWATPALPADRGWAAVLRAVPFALWWLIIIEGAALAAEEAHAPARTIPRGLTWAVVTVAGMVVLTTGTACGALDYREFGKPGMDYPLAEIVRRIPAGSSSAVVYGFGVVALCGLAASYHGLLYGASRQAFALGRSGDLPAGLGRVHPRRQTPVAALAVSSLLAAGFVVAARWVPNVLDRAVLVAGFAALVLYVLSMGCLLVLRHREPGLFARYRAPLGRLLPAAVTALSAVALAVYLFEGATLSLALGAYAVGAGLFAFARRHPVGNRAGGRWAAGPLLNVAAAALIGIGLAALGFALPADTATDSVAAALLAGFAVLLAAVSVAAIRRTR